MRKTGKLRKLEIGIVIISLILMIPGVCFPQHTYYIDTTGNDSNHGTSPSKPWKTLYRLGIALRDSTWHPGDSVLFKYGQKWEPRTTLPSPNNAGILVINNGKYAGTVSHPIVWGAYGNSALGRPILCAKNVARGIKLIYGGYFSNWRLENLEIHGYIDFHSGYYDHDINGWTWYNLYLNGTDGAGTWNVSADGETHIVRQWANLYEDATYPNIYHYGKASNINISHCQFKDLPKGFNAETMYRNFYFGYNTATNVDHMLTVGQGTNVVIEYNWDISPTAGSGLKIENQRCKLDSVLIRGNLFYCADGPGNVFQSVGINHLQMYNNTFVGVDTTSTTQFGIGWQGEYTNNYNRYAMYSGAGTVIPYSNSLIKNNIFILKLTFNTLKNHRTVSQNGFTWTQNWNMDSMFAHGLNFQRNALYNPAGIIVGNHIAENRTEIWNPNLLVPNHSPPLYGYFEYTSPREYDVTVATPSNFQSAWNSATGNGAFPHKPAFTDINARPGFISYRSPDTSGWRLTNAWAATYGEAIPKGTGTSIYDSGYTHDLAGYRVPQSGSISIGCFQVASPAPDAPKLELPSNGGINQPTTLNISWHPIIGSIKYYLQIALDSNFYNVMFSDSSISDTLKMIDSLKNITSYYWRVRTLSNSGWSSWSTVWNFRTINNYFVQGKILFDKNNNGVRIPEDSNDVGIAGWKIYLRGPVNDTMMTDKNGFYRFERLPKGYYEVSERKLPGWTKVFPSWPIYGFTLDSSRNSVVCNFGYFALNVARCELTDAWNLLSLPLIPESWRKDDIFPTSVSRASGFRETVFYADTLEFGAGYWLKFPEVQTLWIPGSRKDLDTIDLRSGWNMIGAFNDPLSVSSLIMVPDGIRFSFIYGYDGGYFSADSLIPGKGYWVKTSQSGQLIHSTTEKALTRVNQDLMTIQNMNTLSFSREDEIFQTVFFTNSPGCKRQISYAQLPPQMPGAFDVRFEDDSDFGSFAAIIGNDNSGQTNSIIISVPHFPMKIQWEIRDTAEAYQLETNTNERFTLSGKGEMRLDSSDMKVTYSRSVLRLSTRGGTLSEIPTSFDMEQNFPNPFNNSTTISLSVPGSGRVHVDIYNLLGERITTLIDKDVNAGYHTLPLNIPDLASGVYIYRGLFNAPTGHPVSIIRKMILLK